MQAIPDGSHVTIDASNSFHIDWDIIEIIQDFEGTAERRSLTVETLGSLNRPSKAARLEERGHSAPPK